MILLTKCYNTLTPESSEVGEFDESAVMWEDVGYTFRELCDMIRLDGFTQCSCSPARGDPYEWLETGFSITDYRTCTETNYTLHYSGKNPAKNDKYWERAVKLSQM